MEVKLLVVKGGNTGQTVPVTGPKFFIGRAEDCQLRPHSDQVSRHHCVILLDEGYVGIRDFGSKNGTYVNGQQIYHEQELKNGDKLLVGPLEFEVQLSVGVGGKKKPKVHSIGEAAARTVQAAPAADDEIDLDRIFSGDTVSDTGESVANAAADTFVGPSESSDESAEPAAGGAFLDFANLGSENAQEDSTQKKGAGKLPANATGNSRAAAADVLKEMFKRR